MTNIVSVPTPFRTASFRGGSRRDVDPAELRDDQYLFLQNGRVRYGSVSPIKEPASLSQGLPLGQPQGLYIIGALLIAFVAGKAYYKDLDKPENFFLPIGNFQMSTTAERIYIVLIPSSTANFKRHATNGTDVAFTDVLVPSPVCIVCQDGINQPMLIINLNSVRPTLTFNNWTVDDREYVPIGKMMHYYSGKLYIVSPNLKEIYQSVSGRPLDFVIAVDETGNKLNDTNNQFLGEEASRLAHRVDFDDIKYIGSITNNGNLSAYMEADNKDFFIVATGYKTFLVTLDYVDTLFGEPKFRTKFLFPAGVLNHFSVVDVLGDTAFVDAGGLKSYNSILSLNNDGTNSEFSKMFDIYFKGVTQNIVCAETHDNYAFFALKTTYGYKIIVFDCLAKVFVSLDDWAVDSPIIMFAATRVNNTRRLFFMTEDGNVYEAFAGNKVLNRIFYTKEFIAGDTVTTLKPTLTKVITQNCQESGTLYATLFVDRLKGIVSEETVDKNSDNTLLEPPYGNTAEDSVVDVDYGLLNARSGTKISVKLECQFDVEIFMVEQYVDAVIIEIGLEQKQKAFNTYAK